MSLGSGGFGSEAIVLAPASDDADGGWWAAYAGRLAGSGIGETSRRVIEADARHVVDDGVLGAGAAGDPRWPANRVRTGAVMGAVQSGKTASMLGVTALALDAGVDAVVVLGGTRTALWLQTADRLLGQVDVLPDRSRRRVLRPDRERVETGMGLAATSAYAMTSQQAALAVAKRRPLVGVVMKNVAHLAEMADSLHGTLYPAAEKSGRPFHLLVIDDEADDASVVDGEHGDSEARQVPLRIRDLWERRTAPGQTAAPFLHATYLAYTATPHATFLQDPDNPLSPKHFFASLRTPGPEGDWRERSGSYRVPEGGRAWYTGGAMYYRALAKAPMCILTDPLGDRQEQLVDAVRAFLVASAVRVLRAPQKLGPVSARAAAFASGADAQEGVVGPLSMLVHPSPAMDEHFDVASAIFAWAADVDLAAGRAAVDIGRRDLSVEGIRRDMDARPDRWLAWLLRYRQSAHVVARVMDVDLPWVPGEDGWADVSRTILESVVPATTLAVINSDVNADDRPAFSPHREADGSWRAPTNLSTIFVSGNVMSRGLTLEGLTTTYFSRRADEPLADTQMQMQRWFGYRGAYIDLCRVMLTSEQLVLFERYHDDDEALRKDILEAMRHTPVGRPPLTVLQGSGYRATGKIANLRSSPLWPGPKPLLRRMNDPADDLPNQTLVASLFTDEQLRRVPATTGRSGLVIERRLTLDEAADLLDDLVHPGEAGADSAAFERWASVQHHAGLVSPGHLLPLYRPPRRDDGEERGFEPASPYWIAAYLRLWATALDRHIAGMVTTGDLAVPWTLVDLEAKRAQAPRFSVGLRFGEGDVVRTGPLASLGLDVHGMRRKEGGGRLLGGWGSRGSGADGITGDESFDLRARGADLRVGADGVRPPGSDGQLLFHVIQREAGGVSLALGAVIPLGGPTNAAAYRGGMEP